MTLSGGLGCRGEKAIGIGNEMSVPPSASLRLRAFALISPGRTQRGVAESQRRRDKFDGQQQGLLSRPVRETFDPRLSWWSLPRSAATLPLLIFSVLSHHSTKRSRLFGQFIRLSRLTCSVDYHCRLQFN
jgi:hypothetical protein